MEMKFMILFWILAALAAAVLGIAYICFRMAFYVPDREHPPQDTPDIPGGQAGWGVVR